MRLLSELETFSKNLKEMSDLTRNNNEFRIKPWQLIIIIALLQTIIVFLTVPMIFTFDESMWHYIGRNWIRNGLVPYSGGVDNKSPLIFLLFGISDWLFGVSYWFPRIVGLFVQSAGIYTLFKIAERTRGPRAGLFTISFYGLSLLWHSTGGKYISYTETYAITAIIISVFYSLVETGNRNSFMGGVFAGLGVGFRLTALFGVLPVFIFAFRKSPKSAFSFLLGISVSLLILIGIASALGIRPGDLFFFGVTDNFGSGSVTDHSPGWKAQQFASGFFYSEIILFYPCIFFYFFFFRKADYLKWWLISEFLGMLVVGSYDRVHFKDLLPAISLMSASVVEYVIENYHAPAKPVMLGIWIVFFPKTFEPLFALRRVFGSREVQSKSGGAGAVEAEELKRKIGFWIRSNTMPDEKVYVAGYGAQIQAYSERISPSIYFNVTGTAFAKKRIFADLVAYKPAMLVIPPAENYSGLMDPELKQFIHDLTVKDYQMDTCMGNYNIFRYNKTSIPK
jgi:hypothetical protein